MSTRPSQSNHTDGARHKTYPPQRMHTRSRTKNSDVVLEQEKNRLANEKPKDSSSSEDKQRNGKKSFYCDTCGNHYDTVGGLKRHQVTHIKAKIHRCLECHQVFGILSELQEHLQLHKSNRSSEHSQDIVYDDTSQSDQSSDNKETSLPTQLACQTGDSTNETADLNIEDVLHQGIISGSDKNQNVVMSSDDLVKTDSKAEQNCTAEICDLSEDPALNNLISSDTFVVEKVGSFRIHDGPNNDIPTLNTPVLPKERKISQNLNTNKGQTNGIVSLDTCSTDQLGTYSHNLVSNSDTVDCIPVSLVETDLCSASVEKDRSLCGPLDGQSESHLKLSENSQKLAQLRDKHVSIKSKYSKEDIDEEVREDPVLGLVSGLVKFCPDLSESDYTEVAKVTGVTVIMLDKQKIVIHGSWKALNRAYAMIESLQKEARKKVEISKVGECIELEQVEVEINHRDTIGADNNDVAEGNADSSMATSDTLEGEPIQSVSGVDSDSFECEKCSKIFWSRHSLQEHCKAKHSEHKCKLCNKVFGERRYLQTHLKRHANIRNYTCPVCGWKFMERFKMNLHMESHKQVKDRTLPYKCDICEKQFYNRASWSDHLNTHTGNRPFSCEVCGNSFAHRIGLKRHMVTHMKEKPYKCDQCDKSFAFKCKLADHMTMHTGISKHQCTNCHRIFTVGASLKRHMDQCLRFSDKNARNNNLSRGAGELAEQMEVTVQMIQAEAAKSDTIYMCGICSMTFDTFEKAEKHTSEHDQSVTLPISDKNNDSVMIGDTEQIVYTEKLGFAVVSQPPVSI